MRKNPEFIVFTGPMFGSKTTQLIATVDRFRYQKRNVVVFKPRMDDRYDEDHIVTHSGAKIGAIPVASGSDIIEKLAKSSDVHDVVAVDEAFMIDDVSDVLLWLYKKGITVVVSSLTISSSCKIFGEMGKILPWATRIEICPAVCPVCGHDAHYTHKKFDDGQLISVGGEELYEPRCFEHHALMNLREIE